MQTFRNKYNFPSERCIYPLERDKKNELTHLKTSLYLLDDRA